MKQTENLLTPADGMMLTQAAADIDIKERIITRCVCLAVNDTPARWREIPADEADQVLQQQENAFNPNTDEEAEVL